MMPTRTLGINLCTNAKNGLMSNKAAPIALGTPMFMHCKKLNRPNTPPIIPPPSGPQVMPATATGITLSVITSGPTGIEPIGVNEKIITRAVIRPSTTS